MRKTIIVTAITILSGFLFGLVCSVAGTVGYVAAQGQPTATSTSPPLPTATSLPTATFTPQPTKPPAPTSAESNDPEAEYYRAIFDVCMYSARKVDIPKEKAVEGCRLFTRQTMKQKWFKEPSQEWKWPIPAEQFLANPNA